MNKSSIKIIFLGTGDFAVPALEVLVNGGYDVVAVATTPDKPVGRKQILTPSPIKLKAQSLKLKVLQPEKLKESDTSYKALKLYSSMADVGMVAAYGKIIPAEIFNAPKHGTLNIHPSLLPKYRGPSPIQTAILNGDTETGVTIMQVDEEMDRGPILANSKFQILNSKFYQKLHDDLAKLGAELLVKILPDYLAGKIKLQPQDHSKATFTKKFTIEDGEIKPDDTAKSAYNKIRAFNPEPGTFVWFEKNGKKMRLKILDAELKNGCLEFKKVQPEGGKPMNIKEFLSGHPNFKPYLL